MTKIRQTSTNFSAGELSPEMLARGDLAAYENGASRLLNVHIQPTGGVTRRAGLRQMLTLPANARLIPFDFPQVASGFLALSPSRMDVFINGAYLGAVTGAPWTAAQIPQVTWAQNADTLLLMHPEVSPRRFNRMSPVWYTLNEWSYTLDQGAINQPYFKFADPSVTVTPSAVAGNITVNASAGVFVAGHIGTRMRIGGSEISVTNVLSATSLQATVIKPLISTAATTDWQEQAFSTVRGFPTTACFHQERLVIGGSRDIPNRIWMSMVGNPWNFYRQFGTDSESIEFGIVSDQSQAVRGLVSGRHLQVFTNNAEFMVTGDPLVPSRVQVRRQTRIGSISSRYIPPLSVEGASFFIARNGQELREFVFTDLEQAYNSKDLAESARHLLQNPIDQTYDTRRKMIYVVRNDGRIATLSYNRQNNSAGWSVFETNGNIQSILCAGDETYAVVQRSAQFTVERFDDSVRTDAAVTQISGTPQTLVTGLTHLNGSSVTIVADGQVRSNQTVSGGQITLSPPALSVEVGLSYRHIVEPLPPALTGLAADGKNIRLVEATFRLRNTSALRLDVGRGLRNVPLMTGQNAILSTTAPLAQGDISVGAFGWHSDLTKPLWRIEQESPVPFTLLGVKAELKRSE